MKEKETSNKSMIVILTLSIFILIGIVVGGTYSFYSARVSKNNPANNNTNVTTSTVNLELTNATVTGTNLIPGDTITSTFKISNKGTQTAIFKLMWNNVTNTFINQKDLIVTLTENGTTIINQNNGITFPPTTASSVLKDNLTLKVGETKNYTLTITYKNTDQNQSADMGKSLNATIGLG